MYGWLFKNIHVGRLKALAAVANFPLKLNSVQNTFLINLNILYHTFSLNTYK